MVTVGTAEHRPGQRPSPHRVLDVVAAATGHKYGLVISQQVADDLGVGVVGQLQIRQRVARKGIGPALKNEYIRVVCAGQRRKYRLERL